MRKILSLTVACLLTSWMSAQTVANMDSLKAEKKSVATSIKLTGKLTTVANSDFRQMRDLCWQLRHVDLSASDCPSIPKNAFHSRHHLQSIILPANLQTIGSQAFFACDKLQSISLPSQVKQVGKAAFSGCKNLQDITINGTPKIEDFAFANLHSLKVITLTSKIPPQASASTFSGINLGECRLVVPKGSEKAYRKAEGWKLFYGINKQAREVCNPTDCLIPVPMKLTVNQKQAPLEVNGIWSIKSADGLSNEQEHALRILGERIDKSKVNKSKKLTLTLALDESLDDPESYTLDVKAKEVIIKGKTAAGVFYGLMTFDQLLRGDGSKKCSDAIMQASVSDQPRTHVRELMLDPVRTFIPFDQLKAFIPEMARYKLNAVHLHLVDDQGWRIEI